jgi:CheY-like chemotaxis protein
MAAAAARRIFLIRRALVVDDDSALRELILDMLGTDTFEFECVGAAPAACERLQDGADFDVLIVGVDLGGDVTGFDVARFARERDPQLPVVYVAAGAAMSAFRALGVPDSRFVARPFTAEQLQDAVELALGEV